MQKHRRGPWSSTEDQHLLHLVHSQGAHNWVRISQLIGSRSPKQCRERFHQNLKPSLNLDPITPEEGVLIERMVAEMGKRWAEIARRLNGRSDNAVKNWWNGGVNRRKRLETRRADAAVTRQPHVTVYCPPGGSAPNYSQQQQQASMYGQGMMHTYPAPAQQYVVEPRSLPYPAAPTPLNTIHAGLHAHRRLADGGPLPSPSAMSTVSRSESCTGAAPSLVSDGGSYTSYSQSPNRSPRDTALPPLASIAGDQRQAGPQYVHQNGQVYQIDDGTFRGQYKTPAYPTYHTSYPTNPQDWSDRSVMQPVVPSQGQLPLPAFQGSAGVDGRSNGPPSPHRDSRMNLSNVMS